MGYLFRKIESREKATWPSGKAEACKAFIPRFESGCRLFYFREVGKQLNIGRLAQLVAHLNDIQGVTSSSLVSPTIIKKRVYLFFLLAIQVARTCRLKFGGFSVEWSERSERTRKCKKHVNDGLNS